MHPYPFDYDERFQNLERYQAMTDERNTDDRSEPRERSGDERFGRYWPLYKKIQEKNWSGVEKFVIDNPAVLTEKIDNSETLVELLIRFGDYKASWLIDRLASMVVPLPGAQQNVEGGTILTFCAASGNLKAIQSLVRYNPDLVNNKCNRGFLPVHYAALYGQKDTFEYLLREMTGVEIYRGKDGTVLLVRLILGNSYDIALDLLRRHSAIGRDDIIHRQNVLDVMAARPFAFKSGSRLDCWQRLIYKLVSVKKEENVSSIQIIDNHSADGDIENRIGRSCECVGQITSIFGAMCHKLQMMFQNAFINRVPSVKNIYELKLRHMQAVEIVRLICEGVIWTHPTTKNLLIDAFFKAGRLGISEFVNEIFVAHSGSVYWTNQEGNTIFHVAVLHRRAKVFNLIRRSNFKVNWLGLTDNSGNNSLHFAGRLVRSTEVVGAALQMQRELQWFKAVEALVHPSHREAENQERQTPRQVFTDKHSDLVKEGEKWMKKTASSCSIVAALIITVVFAAASTARGGNDNRGKPNFSLKPAFLIFAISDGLALFSSIISVLMFLGILTSRYSENDFLLSLPTVLIIGLVSLFFSIASMLVAFGATIYLVLFQSWKWVYIPIGIIACLPVILFAFLQFPLLVVMYSSTYGRRSKLKA